MHPTTCHKIPSSVNDSMYIQLLFKAFAAWLTWSSINVEMKKYE